MSICCYYDTIVCCLFLFSFPVAFTLERYCAVVSPLWALRFSSSSRAGKVIAICWIIAIANAIPFAFYRKFEDVLYVWYNAELEYNKQYFIPTFLNGRDNIAHIQLTFSYKTIVKPINWRYSIKRSVLNIVI